MSLFKRRPKAYKKCPRCGNKCLNAQDRCDECGLLFSRLQYASNKAAKKKIRHFDKDFVIYTNQYPADVSWLKLLLLTFFTGLFGGHYYYVGKYLKGSLMSAGFVYLVFCTIFNAELVDALETTGAYFPIGILALAWIVSLVYVASKKFKVPVIVELPTDDVVVIGDVAIAKDKKNKKEKEVSSKEEKVEIKEDKTEKTQAKKEEPEEPLEEKKTSKTPNRKYLGRKNTKRKK